MSVAMRRIVPLLAAAGGAAGGVAGGFAWAGKSAVCAPGLLQGNPVCLLLLLLGGTLLGVLGLAAGLLIGWIVAGKPELWPREPSAGFRPGPRLRAGALIGTALTAVLHFKLAPGGATSESAVTAMLALAPLAAGIALGAWLDARASSESDR